MREDESRVRAAPAGSRTDRVAVGCRRSLRPRGLAGAPIREVAVALSVDPCGRADVPIRPADLLHRVDKSRMPPGVLAGQGHRGGVEVSGRNQARDPQPPRMKQGRHTAGPGDIAGGDG